MKSKEYEFGNPIIMMRNVIEMELKIREVQYLWNSRERFKSRPDIM